MKSAMYVLLVSSIADQEPRFGWSCAMDLPPLSAKDVSIVCEEKADEVNEHIHESLSVIPLLEDIKAADVCHIGLKFAVAISDAARSVVWRDVQEECERREEYRANDWAERHPETPEGAHGVASLFRESHR